VARSGFYAWIHKPLSDRALEDQRLLELIRDSHQASGKSYGSPRILLDLREIGERCGKHRVARLMKTHNIKALLGYKTHPYLGGRPSLVAPNKLQRAFSVGQADVAGVTDITYIRTWQGWLYLAIVLDLFSRKVIGWSMKPTLAKEIVLDALVMAVWRRQPKNAVLIHSDQGAQYGSDDWIRFCRDHNLDPSMSRRGNC
jgi:putative transposase